jgi:hypothetical protein
MAEQFLSIPLPNHPVLVEAQNYLRRLLPEGTSYPDPATFHMTLVYVEDTKGVDFTQMSVPEHLPIFGLSSSNVDIFPARNTELGAPVHLRFWAAGPQLGYLQAALYYEVTALGGKVSAFSYPGVWKPHITMAYVPGGMDIYLNAPEATFEVREFALTEGDYVNLKTWSLKTDVPIQEQIQAINFVISEAITSKKPNIKIPKDINVEALKKALKVDELVFDVRPIGIGDGKSRNGRVYTRESVESLVAQVNRLRPEGQWGHTKPEDLGSEYKPPAIRWLAAEMGKDGVAWGLVLALTEESRQHILAAKAVNARIGTSIYAINPKLGNGPNEIADYDLVKIDLANAELVGIPEMSTVPEPVLETVKIEGSNPVADENEKKDVETQNGAKSTESVLREQLHEAQQEMKKARPALTEHELMCELLGNKDNPIQALKEMKGALEEARKENAELLKSAISEAVNKAVLIDDARDIIREQVEQMNPTTRAEIQPTVEKVMARESVKKLLAKQLVVEMGPPHGTPATNPKKAASTSDWFETDDEGGNE